MSLRWRLSLWYGTLCALALALVSLVGYTVSVREQYLTLDRVLTTSTRLVENAIVTYGRTYAIETDTTRSARDGIVMVLRSYSPAGELMYLSASDPGLPRTKAVEPLLKPAPPAYLEVLPWLFLRREVTPSPNAAFGTLELENQRWRRYVVQVSKNNHVVAYVEALTPLGHLDASSRRLARLLLNLALFSVLAVLLVGWLLAGTALRPVSRLISAARDIALSHDLRRRVHTNVRRRDELGRLATTFNEMLDSLEAAWKSQQRFVGDASHELRAPLTVMRGNLELLRRYPGLDETQRGSMLGEIEREATRLSRLVEDLLLLARSDAGITLLKRPVDFQAVAQEAVRDARRIAPEHQVKLEWSGQDMTVMGDPDRLKQLLLILLDNATKYSAPGSRVTVNLGQQQGQVYLQVQDQGEGIPADAIPHIFERFFRADPARGRDSGGAGLGLSIAEWIAQQLSAKLWVQDSGTHGTTFGLLFPETADLQLQDEPPAVLEKS